MARYTLKDLEAAKTELEIWQQRWNNYSGNNPDKYQTDIRLARQRVYAIEAALKDTGAIPMSEKAPPNTIGSANPSGQEPADR